MDDNQIMPQESLSTRTARNLATTTKSLPMMEEITPRWLLHFLPWVPVTSGTYRVNRVKVLLRETGKIQVCECDGQFAVDAGQLLTIPLFSLASPEEAACLAAAFVPEEYQKGETIISADESAGKFCVLVQGAAEASTTGDRGQKLQLSILSSGHYFGDKDLLADGACGLTITALSSCLVLALSRTQLEAFLEHAPRLRERMLLAVQPRECPAHVNEHGESKIALQAGHEGEALLPTTFADYTEMPREYPLSIVQTILRLHTRVTDLYNDPINQFKEQLRLAVEAIKEKQEWELINNSRFGLLHSIAPSMRLNPRYGPPTPDDMDELLARVWKKPALFLAHPKAIAAFGRECTRRGVPPATVNIWGSPFLTWRGVPIVPCNKLMVNGKTKSGSYVGTTSILLLRLGEQDQGVIGLHQPGIPDEISPSLSARLMGIDNKAISSYLLTLYFSTAVLTEEALASLDNVEVGFYHEYAPF